MPVICPKCHEANVRRSHRRAADLLPRWIGMVPLRCNLCECRFYRFRKGLDLSPGMQTTPEPASARPVRAER
jgi:hypothetical protein